MKEINIAQTIVKNRKSKGITQEDLADYMGVSKACVSKWETGQSYPDITFLPRLAAYFNISIDELMSYAPQMTAADSQKLYHKLAKNFSEKPFEKVYEECEETIKKYYSCFPVLMQMCVLLINHYIMADGENRQKEIIENVITLCVRIKEESADTNLSAKADQLHGMCLVMMNRPSEAVDLLETEDQYLTSSSSCLLANAYLAMGKQRRAEEVLQIDIYKHLITMVNEAPMLLSLSREKPEKAEQIISRMFTLTEVFHIEKLNFNAVLLLCLAAGETYIAQGNQEKAMEYLSKYTDICCSLQMPMRIRGDEFFDHIDEMLEKLDMDPDAPREERLVRESMSAALTQNPAFAQLGELPEFQSLLRRLKAYKGEEK